MPTTDQFGLTAVDFLHSTEIRIQLLVIVPRKGTVPGGSGTAVAQIQMGDTLHLAHIVMAQA